MFTRLFSKTSKKMSLLHNLNVPTKRATFAMGCFWGPDSLFGAQLGVVRTRVGYSGGKKENPAYKSLGDHSESIDIEFDPNKIQYNELLAIFWDNHNPSERNTIQYTSRIFYHDEEQKAIAEKSLKETQAKYSKPLETKILKAGTFYNAENYHQKYRLQQHNYLVEEIGLKPDLLLSSHLAARLNGYVVGMGGVAQFNNEAPSLGLSEKATEYVRKYVTKYEGHGLTC